MDTLADSVEFTDPRLPQQASPETQPAMAPAAVMPKVRRFGDAAATRQAIFDRTLAAAVAIKSQGNSRHTLQLQDVRYEGAEHFSIADQKKAIMHNRSLARPLRGTYSLVDNATGGVLEERRMTLARIPYLTNRGTFIQNGNEYGLSHQLRLRPGIFTRLKDNGELESHVNVSKGQGHRLSLEPESGLFKVQFGQARIPLAPLLKAMGATHEQLTEAWGSELTGKNNTTEDGQALGKLAKKLLGAKAPLGDAGALRAAVVKAVSDMEIDPEVTSRTLGKPYTHVTLDALLDTTRKLIRVNRGEDESDDRDAMAFQKLVGPEDYFAERITKARETGLRALWKASGQRGLKGLAPGLYDDAIRSVLMSSGLASPLEEINTAELLDQQSRVTRLGEGGIGSLDAVPDDSRAVQPSQFGFVDFLRTAESSKAGIDLRLGGTAMKGENGNIYAQVRNVHTGELEFKTPQDLADIPLAFPGELKRGGNFVSAIVKGRVRQVSREAVEFEVPHMERTFSALGNAVPLKSMVKGQRAVMAARMITQALPLVNAEAPYVQSGLPDTDEDRSFEDEHGTHMGAVRSKGAGRVMAVTPDGIKVKYADGNTETHDLYNQFPFNRKTLLHNTAMVQPGDVVEPNQLLAKSNFTDDKGTMALGMNLRVAYIPRAGQNFEDANVISESAAKRFSSEHMYQHAVDWDKDTQHGKAAYISMFPGTYNKAALAQFDDNGVLKAGSKVNFGDPLILAVKTKEPNRKSLLRSRQSYSDATTTWDHHSQGEVTDVRHDERGASVVIKAISAAKVGDKVSGRFGDKGVISAIIPDDEMPVDSEGRPFEALLNPLGITSRTNPAQLIEAALGKIAEKTGKPYKFKDFQDSQEDAAAWAMEELKKAGLPDKETIVDPRNGRKIPGIATGNRWFMKLHHTSESKLQARGTGAYTSEGLPAKGGAEGSKRIGMLELSSLLSHGATQVVRDAKLIRGQADPRFWSQYMSGHPLPTPKVPHVYTKFINDLKASGINPVRQGTRTQLMAMTDRDVDELVGDRELQNADTVNWDDMSPVPGGLFDQKLTGGHGNDGGTGSRWSFIRLTEPMPNPVFEEPIKRVLGLTGTRFEAILSGKEKLNEQTGPAAIASALSRIDLPRELASARTILQSGKKTQRDAAIRRFGYLKSAEQLGVHPRDWMLSKVPVLPPIFRPVSTMGPKKLPLVADPNYLYRELFQANKNLQDAQEEFGSEDTSDERLQVYNSFKAVTGLGEPTQPKNQERQVKGLLKTIFGSSPKYGVMQRKLLGTSVDLVGRSVVAPDPDLDMDQLGVPESMAWNMYKPTLIRRLVRDGMSRMVAVDSVENKSKAARAMLLDEMSDGVVVMNRAPTLHRYGIMAFRPQLITGDVMKVPPLVVGGLGMDFDGDAAQLHVPLTKEAREEALEKMLPSRNLLAVSNFKPMYKPSQEFVGGLYEASARVDRDKPSQVFKTKKDAIEAYRRGEIGVGQQVEIME